MSDRQTTAWHITWGRWFQLIGMAFTLSAMAAMGWRCGTSLDVAWHGPTVIENVYFTKEEWDRLHAK